MATNRAAKSTAPVIRMAPTESLIPYARNARTHSDEQVAQIAASIREFGFTNPILTDGERGVIAGHGRLAAARMLGLAEVPTIELAHLSETQRRAYILADNRLAEKAGWDAGMLEIELDALRVDGFDLELIGFGESDLADVSAGAGDVDLGDTGDESGDDDAEEQAGGAMVYPVLANLTKPQYERLKAIRKAMGGATASDAIARLIEERAE